jgi:predicted nucleic acid-binding protein
MEAILLGTVEVVVTTEILNEYEEIMGKYYSSDYATLILKGLLNLPNVIRLNPIYYQWGLITIDEDDNKFVDAYIGSNADWIITYDKHFRVLNDITYPKILCCNLEDFSKILEK